MKRTFDFGLLAGVLCAQIAFAQSGRMRLPENAVAGQSAEVSTSGSGKATLYIIGPGSSSKQEIELGQSITLKKDLLKSAGRYVASVCSGSCESATFFVAPADPANLTVLAHPSRAPVGKSDVISAVAFAFDRYRNLALSPVAVNFKLMAGDSPLMTQTAKTKDGVAWMRTTSGSRAGIGQLFASIGSDVTAKRVVQLVASDPCNLRIKAQTVAKGIVVETDPVRDCAGNPVPDGTIVTFTATDSRGKSTVDAPVKQGVARAQITASGSTVISVASGVAMGNELRIGAPR